MTRKPGRGSLFEDDKSDEKVEIGGGAGGYWAMIKAICDDPPPTPGPEFSPEFHEFIACCLKREPSERLTAQQLLETTFIRMNLDPDSLTDSDKLRLKINTSSESDIADMVDGFEIPKDSKALPDRDRERDSDHSNHSHHSHHSIDSVAMEKVSKERDSFATLRAMLFPSPHITPLEMPAAGASGQGTSSSSVATPTRKGAGKPSSPDAMYSPPNRSARLTARSATAAVVRKEFTSPGSRSFDVSSASSDLTQRRNSKDTEINAIKHMFAGTDALSTKLDIGSKDTDTDKQTSGGGGIASAQGSNHEEDDDYEVYIMNAIRLEHFDRVLEKIASKISAKKPSSFRKKSDLAKRLGQEPTGTGSDLSDASAEHTDGLEDDDLLESPDVRHVDSGNDNDYGDLGIGSSSIGDVGEYSEIVLVNTNIDSEMDRLLNFKGSQQPLDRNRAHKYPNRSHLTNEANNPVAAQNPIEILRSTNAASQHSILKGGNSQSNFSLTLESKDNCNNNNTNNNDITAAVASALEQMSFASSSGSGKIRRSRTIDPEDKASAKQPPLMLSSSSFSSSKSTSSREGANSNGNSNNGSNNNNNNGSGGERGGGTSISTRSVHFMDPDQSSYSLRSIVSNSNNNNNNNNNNGSFNIGGVNNSSFVNINASSSNSLRPMNSTPTKPPLSGAQGRRPNLKSLQLDLVEDDELDLPVNAIPNNFKQPNVINKSNSNSNGKKKKDNNLEEEGTIVTPLARLRSRAPVTPSSNTPSIKQATIPVDYKSMLPKLDEKGLKKWKSLADQLRLPFHLVKLAVKARLGDLVDLSEQPSENGDDARS